ncbi:hypothetical protein CIRG_08944 [Coccidioides immitis RMSCC 2394]|uniref:Uncharacterized protein n=1 Tax=Coccidioides immitis RMSCC 2394 TaxID=404692 RepID=A0A0J6YM34_COCIT|nr:hypothetical protein CIRG_08944 [Coccidioides immitis RMSCC 2394]
MDLGSGHVERRSRAGFTNLTNSNSPADKQAEELNIVPLTERLYYDKRIGIYLTIAPAGSAVYTTENHLAGLVEAATAAAGQNVGWAQPEDGDTTMSGEARVIQSQLDGYTVGMQLEDGFTNPGNAPSSHFILPGPSGQASANGGKQIAPATDSGPPTEGNPSGQIFHPSKLSLMREQLVFIRPSHFFRQPSATSKKYTRPPMSKLFASLELSPENFLHLQAAAKAYMLDVNHPERRDCVGQRGKGDTEMVRLRLWNCVSEFLDKEGNGPRFFGENVVNEGMGPRQMIWPRDDQKIISLMMPLLRRMVTNERQRQYAIETRKCGNSEEKKRKQMETGIPKTSAPTHETHFQQLGETGIGMLDLLSGGYPSDWESITQSYDSYNEGYRLDNLGAISGLPQQDWLGLVAAVDCHYQIDHHGNGAECDQPCQDCMVNHIVSSDSVSHANWRIAGQGDGLAARTYFASGITRDVSHIIKESLINRAGNPHDPKFTSSATFAERPSSEPFVPQPSALAPIVPATHSAQGPPRQESKSLTSVKLFISIVQNGDDKRLLPRLELPCDPSAGLSALLKNVRQYYQQQQHLQTHQMPVNFRINAWLKNGLVPIGNDEEWMAALMAAHMVDWMDGELRIIVDGGGGNV